MTTRVLVLPSGVIEFYDISSETALGTLYSLAAPVALWKTAQEAKSGLEPWGEYSEDTWFNDLLHRDVPLYLIDLYGRLLNENMSAIAGQAELVTQVNGAKSFGTRALMPFAVEWDAEKFIMRLRVSQLQSARPTPKEWFWLIPIELRPFVGIK